MLNPRFLPAGDSAISVEFGNAISTQINTAIRAFNLALHSNQIDGIIETVPSYRSLMVHYRPEKITFKELCLNLEALTASIDLSALPPPEVVEIPVLYSTETGPDLEFVAKHSNKTTQEVIEIHSSAEYLVYMLGFTPGFPYLGGMSKEIATPRLENPRIKIEGGSVGIAGEQTGVYPIDSPGGWQLIGKTPIKLYDPTKKHPLLLKAGQFIRFVPINKQSFDEITVAVSQGTYSCKTYLKQVQ